MISNLWFLIGTISLYSTTLTWIKIFFGYRRVLKEFLIHISVHALHKLKITSEENNIL
jgi:hypothetical protein